MQTIQNRHIAVTRASIGEPPRLPEQPRAPSDAKKVSKVKGSVSNTAELRDFIEENAADMLQKAKVFCYGNTDQARDIVQELYPRMLLVLEHSQCGGIAYPWACAHQIMARFAIDSYRKERRTRARIKRLEFPDSIPDKPPLKTTPEVAIEELCHALDSLSARDKAIVVGIFLDGCKAKDVAARLGISASRLSELKALALKQLREVLA